MVSLPLPLPRILTVTLVTVFLLSCIGHSIWFVVPEGSAAVVIRLGRPVREIRTSGAGWKWPTPLEHVHLVDTRRRILDAPRVTTFTRDKKNIDVTTFVIWHIEDPLLFLQATGSVDFAVAHLSGIVVSAKNQEVGKRDLSALLSLDTREVQVEQIEAAITAQVGREARAHLGIAVDWVGFQRISLPPENVTAVLERMRAERQAEAGRVRAEGAKAAQAVRDAAHVESQQILQRGREEASRITASTERDVVQQLTRYADAYPEFFRFWTSLQASKTALAKQTTLVLRTDQLFFDALEQPLPAPRSAPTQLQSITPETTSVRERSERESRP